MMKDLMNLETLLRMETLHPRWQITGGEQDTLADPVGRKGLAMLVCIVRLKGQSRLCPRCAGNGK